MCASQHTKAIKRPFFPLFSSSTFPPFFIVITVVIPVIGLNTSTAKLSIRSASHHALPRPQCHVRGWAATPQIGPAPILAPRGSTPQPSSSTSPSIPLFSSAYWSRSDLLASFTSAQFSAPRNYRIAVALGVGSSSVLASKHPLLATTSFCSWSSSTDRLSRPWTIPALLLPPLGHPTPRLLALSSQRKSAVSYRPSNPQAKHAQCQLHPQEGFERSQRVEIVAARRSNVSLGQRLERVAPPPPVNSAR